MHLITYPYAAPPVRLQQLAADGLVRLRFTLRDVDYAGRQRSDTPVTADSDDRHGFTEAAARFLELAPALRGQLCAGGITGTYVLGAESAWPRIEGPSCI